MVRFKNLGSDNNPYISQYTRDQERKQNGVDNSAERIENLQEAFVGVVHMHEIIRTVYHNLLTVRNTDKGHEIILSLKE